MGSVGHLYVGLPEERTGAGRPDLGRWLRALAAEVEIRDADRTLASRLETILVGGGDGGEFGPPLMGRLRQLLGPARVGGVREWTGEVDPPGVTGALLGGWEEGGATRVNLRLGSLDGPTLAWLERGHGPDEGRAALDRLARGGLPSWGVDLAFGAPPRTDPQPLRSLEAVLAREPPHVSLYEADAWASRGLRTAPGPGPDGSREEAFRADRYLELGARLEAEGYEAYEMTAFARPGHASLHHRAVLRGRPYLGMGPGAHSFIEGSRSWNLSRWEGYSTRVFRGAPPEADRERPPPGARRLERLWSRLRLREGLPLDELADDGRERVRRWIREGWARPHPTRLQLTFEGWLRLDGIVLDLTEGDEGEPGAG